MRNAAEEEEEKAASLSELGGALSDGEMETAAGGKRLAGSQRKRKTARRARDSLRVGEGGSMKFHNEQIWRSLEFSEA